jgi:hypothetical protein
MVEISVYGSERGPGPSPGLLDSAGGRRTAGPPAWRRVRPNASTFPLPRNREVTGAYRTEQEKARSCPPSALWPSTITK